MAKGIAHKKRTTRTFIKDVCEDLLNGEEAIVFSTQHIEEVKERLDFDCDIKVVYSNDFYIKIKIA